MKPIIIAATIFFIGLAVLELILLAGNDPAHTEFWIKFWSE